jgi:glycerol uptake facilitator-like aquaporin
MYSVEFFGTFIFVLTILCITSIEDLNKFQVAFAIGLSLTISILLTSGLNKNAKAHLNPAVSTAFTIKGDLNIQSFFILILLQFSAALLAIGVFKLFTSKSLS